MLYFRRWGQNDVCKRYNLSGLLSYGLGAEGIGFSLSDYLTEKHSSYLIVDINIINGFAHYLYFQHYKNQRYQLNYNFVRRFILNFIKINRG